MPALRQPGLHGIPHPGEGRWQRLEYLNGSDGLADDIAGNDEVIGTSQTYRSIKSAKNGIESVIFNRNSQVEDQTLKEFETLSNPKWEIYAD